MPATDLFAKIVLKRFSQNLLGNVFRNHGSHFRDLSLTKRLVELEVKTLLIKEEIKRLDQIAQVLALPFYSVSQPSLACLA
jgi:hypothetical protein